MALQSRWAKVCHTRAPPSHAASAEGALFFGYAVPAVAQLLEQLPGARDCEGFRPRYSHVESKQQMPPPKSVTGCARTDGISKRSALYKAQHSIYHRPFMNRGALPLREEPVSQCVVSNQVSKFVVLSE